MQWGVGDLTFYIVLLQTHRLLVALLGRDIKQCESFLK